MDTRKIVLMSQLALYEKKHGKDDMKKACFYKHDYVYTKNMWTRFYAILGGVIFLFIYCSIIFATSGLNYTIEFISDNYKNFIYFLIAIFIFYTIIGKIMYNKEYNRSIKRLESYARLLNKINQADEKNFSDNYKKMNNKSEVER